MRAIRTPAARATDPHTSHEAAAQLDATGARGFQQRIAAQAVERHPGLTSMELAKKTGLDRYMLARRLPECRTASAVRMGEARECSVSGRQAMTWWPPGQPIQLDLVA